MDRYSLHDSMQEKVLKVSGRDYLNRMVLLRQPYADPKYAERFVVYEVRGAKHL
jgi:hypothetical protein